MEFIRARVDMRSFRSDPYLWIHLAGLATVPLWLELCWLGLAIGYPVLPFWLELGLVAAVGALPIFWMQWQRPFYIFSLVFLAVKPEHLTELQRRLLTRFTSQINRILTVLTTALLVAVLRQLYYTAPIAAPAAMVLPDSRWAGLGIAALSFLAANLFVQVPVSVVAVMLSPAAQAEPMPLQQIRSRLTILGFPIGQFLPVPPDVAMVNMENGSVAQDLSGSTVVLRDPEISDSEASRIVEAVTLGANVAKGPVVEDPEADPLEVEVIEIAIDPPDPSEIASASELASEPIPEPPGGDPAASDRASDRAIDTSSSE